MIFPLVVIAGSAVLTVFLAGVGAALPRFVIFDNILRVLIAFFGITAAVVSIIPGLSSALFNLIQAGITAAGGGTTAVNVWVWVFALIGACVIFFGRKSSFGGLVLRWIAFILLTAAMFHYSWAGSIADWYGSIAESAWHFLVGVFNWAVSHLPGSG